MKKILKCSMSLLKPILTTCCSPVGGGTEVVESSGVVVGDVIGVVASVVVEVSKHLLSLDVHSLHKRSIVEQLFRRMHLDTQS